MLWCRSSSMMILRFSCSVVPVPGSQSYKDGAVLSKCQCCVTLRRAICSGEGGLGYSCTRKHCNRTHQSSVVIQMGLISINWLTWDGRIKETCFYVARVSVEDGKDARLCGHGWCHVKPLRSEAGWMVLGGESQDKQLLPSEMSGGG